MMNVEKQLTSFILPITVLILVPLSLEKSIEITHAWSLILGLLIIAIGLCVLIITISSLVKIGSGTLAPWSPTKKLVTEGIYSYVRNPMIIAVLTILIGESISILSIKIFIWAIIFFIINNIFFILYEEPNLEKKFNGEYKDYKRKVNRWIPKLKPFTTSSEIDEK